jgi:hypothetical protein
MGNVLVLLLYGPISGAARSLGDDLPTLLFAELIAIPLLFFAIFGVLCEGEGTPVPLRGAARVVMIGVGVFFLWDAFSGLSRTGNNTLSIVVFLLAAGGLGLSRVSSMWKFKGLRDWTKTTANVEEVNVREIWTRSSHYFEAETAYSYVVHGEFYSGRFSSEFEDEESASQFADKTKASALTVRYNPKIVERSSVVR